MLFQLVVAVQVRPMRSLDLGLYELSTNEKFVVGGVGWGRLGVIIMSNLNPNIALNAACSAASGVAKVWYFITKPAYIG